MGQVWVCAGQAGSDHGIRWQTESQKEVQEGLGRAAERASSHWSRDGDLTVQSWAIAPTDISSNWEQAGPKQAEAPLVDATVR